MTINELMRTTDAITYLYSSKRLPAHWVVQHVLTDGTNEVRTWFIVPAIVDGWSNRTIYRGPVTHLDQVTVVMGMGVGMPGLHEHPSHHRLAELESWNRGYDLNPSL